MVLNQELIAKVIEHPKVTLYLDKGNEYLAYRGTIKLDIEHAQIVAVRTSHILESLGYSHEDASLGYIAGFLHDIGNMVNRYDHGRTGGLLSYKILLDVGMPIEDAVKVMGAIGNHEEANGCPVNILSAAVIIADKSELHRDRVRKKDIAQFSGRDRVNFAVQMAELNVNSNDNLIVLNLQIDQSICTVMEYFEIFLPKMLMCQKAADFLNCKFKIIINGVALL